jgi:hypothetical protein
MMMIARSSSSITAPHHFLELPFQILTSSRSPDRVAAFHRKLGDTTVLDEGAQDSVKGSVGDDRVRSPPLLLPKGSLVEYSNRRNEGCAPRRK